MKERIVRYSSEELMAKTTPSLTDWDRVRNMKDEDIDFSDIPELDEKWFKTAKHIKYFDNEIDYDKMSLNLNRPVGRPRKKERLKRVEILLDNKTIEWLKKTGRGWSTRLRKAIQNLREKNLL